MRCSYSLSGNLRAMLTTVEDRQMDANRAGMVRASASLQADLRDQVVQHRLGSVSGGLAKAWQMQVYPTSGRTLDPVGLVYSRATVVHRAFSEGADIAPLGGRRYLVLPTREAYAMGFATTTKARAGGLVPGGQLRRASQLAAAEAKLGPENLHMIKLRTGKRMIVYTPPNGRRRTFRARGGLGLGVTGAQSIPLFILVPQVHLAARISLDAAEDRAQATLLAELETATDNAQGQP